MTKFPLDIEIERLVVRLGQLSDRSLAAFFICCAERLFPLYEHFSRNSGWGKSTEVRLLIDKVWQGLLFSKLPEWGDALTQIAENLTPHVDDFDTLDATFAQDVLVCLDAAIRAISERDQCDPRWLEYAFEGLRMAVCNELTGYLDIGNSPEQEKFQNELVHNKWIAKELASQYEDLDEIKEINSISEEVVTKMKDRARRNSWTIDMLK